MEENCGEERERGETSPRRRLFERINWKDNNSISQYLKTNPGNYRKRVLPIWRKGCSTNWEDILKKSVEWYAMSPEAQHLEVKKKLPTITRALRRSWEKNVPQHPGQPLLQNHQEDHDDFMHALQEIRNAISASKQASDRSHMHHGRQSNLTYTFNRTASSHLDHNITPLDLTPPTEQELVQKMVSKMHSNEELKQKAREAAGYTTPSTTTTAAPSESQLVQRMVTTMQSNPMLNQKAREAAGYSLAQANTTRLNGRRPRLRKSTEFNGFVPAVPQPQPQPQQPKLSDIDKKATADIAIGIRQPEVINGAARAREAAGYSLAQLALSVPPATSAAANTASLSPVPTLPNVRTEMNPELQARARAAAGYSPTQASTTEPKPKRRRTSNTMELQDLPDDSVIQARNNLLRSFAVFVDTCKSQPEGRPQIHSVLTIMAESPTPNVLVASSSNQAAIEVNDIGKGDSTYEYDNIDPGATKSNRGMRDAVEDFITDSD